MKIVERIPRVDEIALNSTCHNTKQPYKKCCKKGCNKNNPRHKRVDWDGGSACVKCYAEIVADPSLMGGIIQKTDWQERGGK